MLRLRRASEHGGLTNGRYREPQLVQHRHHDARIVAESAHPAVAGIERAHPPGFGRKRELGAIIVANARAQRTVACGRAEFLDPRMLVRRDSLVGELPTHPMSLFGEDNPAPEPRYRERRSAGAEPSSDNSDVRSKDFHIILDAARPPE